MPNYAYIVLIPLLPLAGFVVLGLFGRRYFRRSSGVIGTGLVLISTGLALWVSYQYFFGTGDEAYAFLVHRLIQCHGELVTLFPASFHRPQRNHRPYFGHDDRGSQFHIADGAYIQFGMSMQ